ncbi:MAG: TetR/AcrR family transcriptional regulator [Spirochaetota bacterium]
MTTVEEKIKQAAIKEFSRYGFAGARVDRIAKTAKINKAMIYYHFRSKEKLYEDILSILADGINNSLKNIISDGNLDKNKLYSIVSVYIDFICTLDPDFVKVMLRELSSGGKYFRKIVFIKTLQPLSFLLAQNITKEINNKVFRQLNPFYLIIQTIGSIVFFNMLKINLHGTDLYNIIFKENNIEEFKQNLLAVMQNGIEFKEGTE